MWRWSKRKTEKTRGEFCGTRLVVFSRVRNRGGGEPLPSAALRGTAAATSPGGGGKWRSAELASWFFLGFEIARAGSPYRLLPCGGRQQPPPPAGEASGAGRNSPRVFLIRDRGGREPPTSLLPCVGRQQPPPPAGEARDAYPSWGRYQSSYCRGIMSS